MNNIIVNLIVHADLEFQLDLAFVSFVGIIGGNDAVVEVLMAKGALFAFLPSIFWPVLRF